MRHRVTAAVISAAGVLLVAAGVAFGGGPAYAGPALTSAASAALDGGVASRLVAAAGTLAPAVAVSLGPDASIQPGGSATMSLNATNNTPSTSVVVNVGLALPAGLSLVSTSVTSPCTPTLTGVNPDGVSVWTLLGGVSDTTSLRTGESIGCSFAVTGTTPGTYTVSALWLNVRTRETAVTPATVTILAPSQPPPTVPSGPAPAEADLGVTIGPAFTGYVGGPHDVTITVTNKGPQTAQAVSLVVQLGVDTGGNPIVDLGATAAQPCLLGQGSCNLGAIPAGGSRDVVIHFALPLATIGHITGSVSTPSIEYAYGDNTATFQFGVLQPTVKFLPAVAEPGQVVTMYAESFPPGAPLHLDYQDGRGILSGADTVTVGVDGTLVWPILVLHRDLLGTRTLLVDSPAVPVLFGQVTTDLLVVPARMQPPDFSNRR